MAKKVVQLVPRRNRTFSYWFALRWKDLDESTVYTIPAQVYLLSCGCRKNSMNGQSLRIIIRGENVYHYKDCDCDNIHQQECLLGTREEIINYKEQDVSLMSSFSMKSITDVFLYPIDIHHCERIIM